jgi:hypothetical protein
MRRLRPALEPGIRPFGRRTRSTPRNVRLPRVAVPGPPLGRLILVASRPCREGAQHDKVSLVLNFLAPERRPDAGRRQLSQAHSGRGQMVESMSVSRVFSQSSRARISKNPSDSCDVGISARSISAKHLMQIGNAPKRSSVSASQRLHFAMIC